jgi:hypothetical protein
MSLVVHSPEAEMGGLQVIRVSNTDRTMHWVTFHFESEADATEGISFLRVPCRRPSRSSGHNLGSLLSARGLPLLRPPLRNGAFARIQLRHAGEIVLRVVAKGEAEVRDGLGAAREKSDMLDRELRAEFESYRKTLGSEEARHAFDERIERLLSEHGIDYVRGYVDGLKDAPTTP